MGLFLKNQQPDLQTLTQNVIVSVAKQSNALGQYFERGMA
jgi:hypothetical protein